MILGISCLGDVVRLHQTEQGFAVKLPQLFMDIRPNLSIFDIQTNITKASQGVFSSIRIFNSDLVEFSQTTPLIPFVVQNDFYICVNEDEFYAVVSPHIDPFQGETNSFSLEHMAVFNLLRNMNVSSVKSQVMGRFVSKLIGSINSQAGSASVMDKKLLNVLVREIILNNSLSESTKLTLYDQRLSFLQTKLSLLEERKKETLLMYEKKAKKRVRWIYAFLLSQIFVTQYGTYVKYSWDVMEPISCLLGILDLIIAYAFWMSTNKEYSFETVHENYIQKKERRLIRHGMIEVSEIEDVKEMIDDLETRRAFYSHRREDVYRVLHNDRTDKL